MMCLSQSVVGGVVLTVGDLAPFTKPLMQPISSTAVNKSYWKVNAETTQLRCLDWVLSICNVAFAILTVSFYQHRSFSHLQFKIILRMGHNRQDNRED